MVSAGSRLLGLILAGLWCNCPVALAITTSTASSAMTSIAMTTTSMINIAALVVAP